MASCHHLGFCGMVYRDGTRGSPVSPATQRAVAGSETVESNARSVWHRLRAFQPVRQRIFDRRD